MDMSLIELREEQIEAHAAFDRAKDAIKDADENADLDSLEATFKDAEERYNKASKDHDDEVARQTRARKKFELDQRAIDADKRLNGREERSPDIKVGKEPLTYRRNGEHSIFTDLYRVAKVGDPAGRERSEPPHPRDAVRACRQGRGHPADAQFDLNSTDATGGYLVRRCGCRRSSSRSRVPDGWSPTRSAPPAAAQHRQHQPAAHVDRHDRRDAGRQQLGAETDAAFDTISGDVKTSRRSAGRLAAAGRPWRPRSRRSDLRRPREGYAVARHRRDQLGTANNKGLLQVTGVNAITYTASTPTVAQLYSKIADGIRQVHEGVFMPRPRSSCTRGGGRRSWPRRTPTAVRW
jgi:hypothetical protein